MRTLLLAVVLAVSAIAGGSAQQPSPVAPAPLTPGQAIVLGRVVEAGTTLGITEAIVTLTSGALGSSTALFTDGTPAGSRRVATDGDGRFVFRDLPAGTYFIRVSCPGYVPGSYGETRTIQSRRSLDLDRTLELSDADRPVSVTIQLWKYAGIGGTVRDEAGEPMAGVPITVLSRMTDWSGIVMERVQIVATDDRGMYHADVIPGDYIVGMLGATTTFPAASADEFLRAMSEGGPAQTAYTRQIIGNAGMLPRANGLRLGDVIVTRYDATNRQVLPPFTDLAGRLMLYPTTFHSGSQTAPAATMIRLSSGEERSGINLDLTPIPVRRVSGRVTSPDGAAGNLAVRLIAADAAVARTSPATLIDTPMALTDATGAFTLVGVVPGSYTVHAMRGAPNAPDTMLTAVDTVSVGESDVADLQLTLQPGARIRGQIAVDSTNPPPSFDRFRQLLIHARPLPGSPAAIADTSRMVAPTVEPGRRFMTHSLVPGSYVMVISRIPPGWTLKSVTAAGKDAVDVPFELSASGLGDMVITLTDRLNTVTGTVRDANGQSMRTPIVGVFPQDKALWRVPGIPSRRVKTAAPDRNGVFTFRDLPAGSYLIVAVDEPADFSDPQTLTRLSAVASLLTLDEGETKTQDLRVQVIR